MFLALSVAIFYINNLCSSIIGRKNIVFVVVNLQCPRIDTASTMAITYNTSLTHTVIVSYVVHSGFQDRLRAK